MLEVVEEADGDSGPAGAMPKAPWTLPTEPPALAAASIGLLSGETALELKLEEEEETVDGEGLLTPDPLPPPPFLLMVAMVSAIVCLAACFARSLETKVDTRSFRLPFTSGEASSSSGSTEERDDGLSKRS